MAKCIKIFFVSSALIFSMCAARRNNLSHLNTNVESEAEKVLEQVRKITDGLSVKQNNLETAVQALTSTILQLQNKLETESQAIKHTLFEIQHDNKDMKTELTQLQAKSSSTITPATTAITTTTATTTTTKATTSPLFLHSCDEGWINFNGHCYLLVEEAKQVAQRATMLT